MLRKAAVSTAVMNLTSLMSSPAENSSGRLSPGTAAGQRTTDPPGPAGGRGTRSRTVPVRTDLGGREEDPGEGDAWERYDCVVAEFLFRVLTDAGVGCPTARIAAHCFLDYE
ncbi:hypothetical protein [Streptomyces sp. NPDC059783]|uniref:hypothetical protein n=1 Tax=Streptomyces sp. NPDC059783 TaxID=3346944 RepID=UPI00365B8B37